MIVMTPDPKDFEVTDGNRQVVNARIAVARSHGTGVLPGRSIQRDYLSAAYSDFIFAIVAEELGLAGCLLVIVLYLWLLYRCGRIAAQSSKMFPAAIAMGFGMMIVGQAMINMAVAMGLGPVPDNLSPSSPRVVPLPSSQEPTLASSSQLAAASGAKTSKIHKSSPKLLMTSR